MHRVPRRSSRHVSECVAAGRGRRLRSRSCIPRCKAAPASAALAPGCFLSSSELARRVRLLLMCRARPSVSSSRAAIHVLRSFPLSRRIKLSTVSLCLLSHDSHSPSGIFSRATRLTRPCCVTHDTRPRCVYSVHSDAMSCGERTVARCVDLGARTTTQRDGATAEVGLTAPPSHRRWRRAVLRRTSGWRGKREGERGKREGGRERTSDAYVDSAMIYTYKKASNTRIYRVPHANRRYRDPRAALIRLSMRRFT